MIVPSSVILSGTSWPSSLNTALNSSNSGPPGGAYSLEFSGCGLRSLVRRFSDIITSSRDGFLSSCESGDRYAGQFEKCVREVDGVAEAEELASSAIGDPLQQLFVGAWPAGNG